MCNKRENMNKELSRIVVPFEVKNVMEESQADMDVYVFEGYASTFGNVDRGNDVVQSGAFEKCIKEYASKSQKMPVLWQHDMTEPIGVYIDMREDSRGLYVKGVLPKADAFVRDRVMPQMRVGSVSSMSIGYVTKDYAYDGDIRNIKEAELLETSLVTIPMNTQAIVTNFKAAVPFQDLPLGERNESWDSGQAVMRVRMALDSEDQPSSDYKNAFLWYDENEPDNFGSYKLPIANIRDDRLYAVPRAIFAAAAALRGARGGVDIPDADRAGVITNIERYYRKMGLESPFQERRCLRLDDVESIPDTRTLERNLTKGVFFSEKAAKSVAKLLTTVNDRDGFDSVDRDGDIMQKALDDTNEILKKIGV